MLKTILSAFLATVALALATPAFADTTYYCTPIEPRVTAPDRLVSVEITLRANGTFNTVIYRAANGAIYDRGSQYVSTNKLFNGQYVWIGSLRVNRNIGMLGSFSHHNGQLSYTETIHDNLQGGKVVSEVISICNGATPNAEPTPAVQTPSPAPPVPTPPPSLPTAEFKTFKNCVDTSIVALATLSNEPAQTIVDAALGECPKERGALQDALERHGIAQSVSFVDEIMKEIRPNMLALVLNARASAAAPSQQPSTTQPTKGQQL
jgi:hypothetical protein